MSLRLLALLASASLLLTGCATISDGIDAINPFASSGPKMAALKPFTASAEARTQWSFSAGKARDYTFVPAIVGNSVFVAEADGSIYKLEDGKTIWRTKVGQPISAGVGANASLVVVGTAKGAVLALSRLCMKAAVAMPPTSNAPAATKTVVVVLFMICLRAAGRGCVGGIPAWIS